MAVVSVNESVVVVKVFVIVVAILSSFLFIKIGTGKARLKCNASKVCVSASSG